MSVRKPGWIEERFGSFRYREDSKHRGLIIPDPMWVERKIVTVENDWGIVSCTGRPATIRCHRLVAAKIRAALNDLAGQGLIGLIRTWDGCYVPRHLLWDPKRALSRHAWGIAVDLNARWCPYGSPAQQPAKLVSAFRAHGFIWGGDWKGRGRDPMHFEIGKEE